MSPQLLTILILLVLSGFFSASETAIISLSPAKVRTLTEKKAAGSKSLTKLKENPHKTLITILVGNNLVNILASAMTTVLMTEMFGSAAIGIATGVLTLLVLIFGEIIPKSYATSHASKLALTVAPPLYLLYLILTPVTWLLDQLVGLMLKVVGGTRRNIVTDEELVAMATIGAEQGSIDEHERELIENILEFTDIRVEDVMTPRVHIDSVPEEFTLDEASNFFINHTHSRIPVYRENMDHIVGILNIKEVFKHLHEDDTDRTVRQIDLTTPLKVSESMTIHDVFMLFKRERQHMAIVIDEFGGTAGLVTMEDLLEEIVGDIQDESDLTNEKIKKIRDYEYEVSGRIQIDELEELTGLKLDFPDHKTITYLLTEKLGRIPRLEDSIKLKGWTFTVTKTWRDTVMTVLLKKGKGFDAFEGEDA